MKLYVECNKEDKIFIDSTKSNKIARCFVDSKRKNLQKYAIFVSDFARERKSESIKINSYSKTYRHNNSRISIVKYAYCYFIQSIVLITEVTHDLFYFVFK